MTEMTSIGSMFHHPEDDESGSVGNLLPGMDAKLIDGDGKDITTYDTRGELCVRGPVVVAGYLDNDKANAESFDSEGFFKTGDVVSMNILSHGHQGPLADLYSSFVMARPRNGILLIEKRSLSKFEVGILSFIFL